MTLIRRFIGIVTGINRRDSNERTKLMKAAFDGKAQTVTKLLRRGAMVDIQNKHNRTALMLAAFRGHDEIAEALLAAGCNPDIQDVSGATALMEAAGHGHTELALKLLERGATSNLTDTNGLTALDLADRRKQPKTVAALLKYGVDDTRLRDSSQDRPPDAQDTVAISQQNEAPDEFENSEGDGKSALLRACAAGDASLVRRLLEAGADVDAADNEGIGALQHAAAAGHAAVIPILLDHSGEAFGLNRIRIPQALRAAAAKGHIDVIDAFLAASGALGIDRADDDGWTPLLVAAEHGQGAVVCKLLGEGARADAKDFGGRTALMYAAANCDLDTIGALVEAGAEIDAKDHYPEGTALMWAATQNRRDVAELLITLGANPRLRDAHGKTASERSGHLEMIAFLRPIEEKVGVTDTEPSTLAYGPDERDLTEGRGALFVFEYTTLGAAYGAEIQEVVEAGLDGSSGICALQFGDLEASAGGVSKVPGLLLAMSAGGWDTRPAQEDSPLANLSACESLSAYAVALWTNTPEIFSALADQFHEGTLRHSFLGYLLPRSTQSLQQFQALCRPFRLHIGGTYSSGRRV